jgi:hypothetical protein
MGLNFMVVCISPCLQEETVQKTEFHFMLRIFIYGNETTARGLLDKPMHYLRSFCASRFNGFCREFMFCIAIEVVEGGFS